MAQSFVIWVRQMPESKHFLGVCAARVCCVINFDDIRQLKWILLLLWRHPAADSLLRIEHHLIPEDVARNGHNLIRIAPWQVDATRFQVFLSRDQALRGKLIITKRPKQLRHQDVSL